MSFRYLFSLIIIGLSLSGDTLHRRRSFWEQYAEGWFLRAETFRFDWLGKWYGIGSTNLWNIVWNTKALYEHIPFLKWFFTNVNAVWTLLYYLHLPSASLSVNSTDVYSRQLTAVRVISPKFPRFQLRNNQVNPKLKIVMIAKLCRPSQISCRYCYALTDAFSISSSSLKNLLEQYIHACVGLLIHIAPKIVRTNLTRWHRMTRR